MLFINRVLLNETRPSIEGREQFGEGGEWYNPENGLLPHRTVETFDFSDDRPLIGEEEAEINEDAITDLRERDPPKKKKCRKCIKKGIRFLMKRHEKIIERVCKDAKCPKIKVSNSNRKGENVEKSSAHSRSSHPPLLLSAFLLVCLQEFCDFAAKHKDFIRGLVYQKTRPWQSALGYCAGRGACKCRKDAEQDEQVQPQILPATEAKANERAPFDLAPIKALIEKKVAKILKKMNKKKRD